MSVYPPKKSPFYAYDFQIDGRRFHGSTGCKNLRDAKRIEAEERARAIKLLEMEREAGDGPLTLSRAAGRYWIEVGQHHAGAKTTWANLERLVDYLGPTTLMAEISDDEVAKLIAWRRAQTIGGRKTIRDLAEPKKRLPAPLISASTVNRSTIEPLQKLFSRAIGVWRVRLQNAPNWSKHLLDEPGEIVREVKPAEEKILRDVIRPDYLPLINFARASGLRRRECLLRKAEVDLRAGRIETIGKGGKRVARPITTEMRAILMAEMANPTAFVFTYRAARAKKGKNGYPKGASIPITASGFASLWRRARKAGLPADLRIHDLRHDFATTLLRETGNLKLVQRALGHSKIETTTRYAHVLDDEVLAGMEAASKRRNKS